MVVVSMGWQCMYSVTRAVWHCKICKTHCISICSNFFFFYGDDQSLPAWLRNIRGGVGDMCKIKDKLFVPNYLTGGNCRRDRKVGGGVVYMTGRSFVGVILSLPDWGSLQMGWGEVGGVHSAHTWMWMWEVSREEREVCAYLTEGRGQSVPTWLKQV